MSAVSLADRSTIAFMIGTLTMVSSMTPNQRWRCGAVIVLISIAVPYLG